MRSSKVGLNWPVKNSVAFVGVDKMDAAFLLDDASFPDHGALVVLARGIVERRETPPRAEPCAELCVRERVGV